MSDENLFLEEMHPASRRFATFEDDGTSAWLYLTEPDSHKPIADAWVFNRIAAPSLEQIKQYRGGPPPAAQGYASDTAICDNPMAHIWSFIWSSDGESVAVAKNGKPVAFIVAGQKGGYSHDLVSDGPWGHTWSDELLRSTFGAV